MDKNKLYIQINTFKEELSKRYYKKGIKEVDEYFYYVSDSNALDKAEFIAFLIKNGLIDSEYVTILDLTFGSGNLTSHVVFDNNIKYDHIIYNDLNDTNTNQDIINYVDSSNLTHQNILEDTAYQGNEADLVIINPQIGRGADGYIDGDILRQKEDGEKEQELLERLGVMLKKFLNNGATVLFYGKEKDFKSILPDEHFINYQSKLIDMFVISRKYNEDLCFEREDNTFVICKESSTEDEEIDSFDDVEIEVNKYEINKSHEKIEEKREELKKEEQKQKFSTIPLGNLDFPYRNILLKGVPGTGKSRAIDNIISKHLILEEKYRQNNTLRINIHSASSNADLMQGIGISTKGQNIIYEEKQGLILDFIRRATYLPNQPFALVLEEIQENSLNELIGDLIYLIDEEKRTVLTQIEKGEYSYAELVQLARKSHEEENKKLLKHEQKIFNTVKMPNLVSSDNKYKEMILPDNLYIFCTSNYRDDKKIIEDNLLRRFEVIEIYPNKDVASEYVQEFLESLNTSILTIMQRNHEIHPDRYMIGHAIWKDVKKDGKSFFRAFLKLITEFKDIREIEFDIFKNIIKGTKLPDDIEVDIETKESYFDLIQYVQNKIAYDFLG